MMFKQRKALAVLVTIAAGMLICAGLAYAEVVFNEQIPISGTILDPCSGHDLVYSGNLHEVDQITVTPKGGTHVDTSVNVDSFTLTDTVNGTTYSTHDKFKFAYNAPTSGSFTEVIKETFALTSHCGADNYKSTFFLH